MAGLFAFFAAFAALVGAFKWVGTQNQLESLARLGLEIPTQLVASHSMWGWLAIGSLAAWVVATLLYRAEVAANQAALEAAAAEKQRQWEAEKEAKAIQRREAKAAAATEAEKPQFKKQRKAKAAPAAEAAPAAAEAAPATEAEKPQFKKQRKAKAAPAAAEAAPVVAEAQAAEAETPSAIQDNFPEWQGDVPKF